jgi:hypothetical protein
MVKPPMRSIMVGENMIEKTYLRKRVSYWQRTDGENGLHGGFMGGKPAIQFGFDVLATDNPEQHKQQRHKH